MIIQQEERQYAVPDKRGPEFLPDPCSLVSSVSTAWLLLEYLWDGRVGYYNWFAYHFSQSRPSPRPAGRCQKSTSLTGEQFWEIFQSL